VKSIRVKLTIALGLFAVLFSAFVTLRTWQSTCRSAEESAARQAELAIEFDLAIRQHVAEEIRPVLERHTGPDEFIPEAMSTSCVARRVFQRVCKKLPEYIIKFSSDNPRNPSNTAGPEELNLLDYFRRQPDAGSWSGRLDVDGKRYLVRCVPRRMEAACLRCHGRPEDAPASLLARYGREAGFRRVVGDVIALDTVGIPMDRVEAAARAEARTQLAAMGVGTLVLLGGFLIACRRIVDRRLAAITGRFQCAAEQDDDAPPLPIPVDGNDEIAVLATSFNALAARLRRLHGSLEKRVEERTAELQAQIAERQRAEQELKSHASALEQANRSLEEYSFAALAATRAKSEFLANMSHEIRTPITAILGYTEMLLEQVLTPEGQEALAVIARNGQHLLAVINDILDISKVEAGQLTVDRTACSLPELLEQVKSSMDVRAEGKGLQLGIEYAGPVPQTILTDPTRLRQILMNLVGNAVKFTEAGSVRIVVSPAGEGKPELWIDVIDTGIGMTAEQLARAFQAFSQADASTTRRFGGTGLGLAISKRLAELLGGDVTILRSRPGAGSHVRLSLPAASLEETATASGPAPAGPRPANPPAPSPFYAPLPDCRILLVEDGPDNQRLISLILRKAGAQVVVAENGEAAVEAALSARARGEPFDLVLMDIQMPVMDGYQATALLRQNGYQGPIVALTAHAMAGERERCLDAGCDEYLSKPIGRAQLLATVASRIEGSPKLVREGVHQPVVVVAEREDPIDSSDPAGGVISGT